VEKKVRLRRIDRSLSVPLREAVRENRTRPLAVLAVIAGADLLLSVALRFPGTFFGVPHPHSPCAFCGGTRCFFLIHQVRLAEAYTLNPLVFVTLFCLIWIGLIAACSLISRRMGWVLDALVEFGKPRLVFLSVLMTVLWLLQTTARIYLHQ